jgi:cytochrome c oxidase cbb3-type subunit III
MTERQFSSCFTALIDPIRRPRKRDLIVLAAIAALLAFGPIPQLAQETPQPPATPDAIERGHLFFSDNCGICHGPDAHNGDRGPDLNTGRFKHGGSDADLFRTITHGIPGTIMPANNLPADQVRAIITFRRSTVVAALTPITGNRENGEKFFWNAGKCADCHMVHGKGGVFGPDLSQIGGTRTMEYLTAKLRDPSRDITTGLREPNADYNVPISNASVTVVTLQGQRISGVPKNEDTFSLQMMGSDNELHLFLKKDLREVIHERKSPMPAYPSQVLSDAALKDLLAYLASLE